MGILIDAAKLAGCKIIFKKQHVFKKNGGGRTAILILSTSHAAIHTWPEKRYAAFDLYSCREIPGESVKRIVAFVRDMIFADRHEIQVIPRGHAI